MTFKVPFVFQT